MAINKVEYGGNTLIDITDTTASNSDVVNGKTFYAADGTRQTGSYTETDPVFSASAASGITSSDITSWNNKSTFSGDYDDLTNKPTIPTVNNGKLTIGRNGIKINDFTANSSTNVNVDISVPVEDVQINGTSILSSGNADIKTNSTYNASTNKIATMSDIPTVKPTVNSNSTKTIGYLEITTSVADINDYTLTGEYSLSIDGNTSHLPFTISSTTVATLKVSGNSTRFYQIIEVPYYTDAYKRNYIVGSGFGNWEKIPTMDDIPQDTGWVNITATKGTWSYLRYRVVGKMVHVEGSSSSFKWSGSGGDNIKTSAIPSEYCPPNWSRHWLIRVAGTRMGLLYITTAGNIGMDYIVNISNGSNYTTAVALDFQVSYMID